MVVAALNGYGCGTSSQHLLPLLLVSIDHAPGRAHYVAVLPLLAPLQRFPSGNRTPYGGRSPQTGVGGHLPIHLHHRFPESGQASVGQKSPTWAMDEWTNGTNLCRFVLLQKSRSELGTGKGKKPLKRLGFSPFREFMRCPVPALARLSPLFVIPKSLSGRVQHFTHLVCQNLRCEGFLEKGRSRIQYTPGNDGVVRVPRSIKRPGFGMVGFELFG